jgi:hypothetical protein
MMHSDAVTINKIKIAAARSYYKTVCVYITFVLLSRKLMGKKRKFVLP